MARLVKYPAVAPFQRLSLPAATEFKSKRATTIDGHRIAVRLARALADSCRRSKKICNSTLTKAMEPGWWCTGGLRPRSLTAAQSQIAKDRPRPAKHADRGLYRPLRTGFTDVVGRCPQAQVRGPTPASISFRLPNEDTPALAPIPIAARERPSNSARSRAARSFRTCACKRQDSSPVRPRKSENGQSFYVDLCAPPDDGRERNRQVSSNVIESPSFNREPPEIMTSCPTA